MKIPYIRTTTDTADTLMLVVKGQPRVLDADHPRFAQIVALASEEVQPVNFAEHEDELETVINFATTALETMQQLSERVSVKGDTIFFDGDEIDNALTKHIVRMVREGDDTWQAPVAFLENVQLNPAKHVRKRLFQWISDRGLTLTPEGNVIGYKGVQATEDNLSVTSGSNTVFVDGTPHTGFIPNPIGATVTMSRKGVDSSRDAACSQGLHVGTFAYAHSFGSGNTLTVEFNPRDVVAIPSDCDYQKIRTCRYVVRGVAHDEAYQGTTYLHEEEEEVFEDEDENEDDDAPFLAEDGDRC